MLPGLVLYNTMVLSNGKFASYTGIQTGAVRAQSDWRWAMRDALDRARARHAQREQLRDQRRAVPVPTVKTATQLGKPLTLPRQSCMFRA